MALSEVDLSHIRNGRTKPAICTTHGAFTDTGVMIRDRIIWMGCAQCALEARDRENARLAKEATKRSEAVKACRIIGDAAIPARYRGRTLEGYVVSNGGQRAALEASREYLQTICENDDSGANLLFYGTSGTGKTHLAIGIAQALIEHGGSALYTRAFRIAQRIKETYGRQSDRNEREVYESFATPDLLVIDEVGRQFGTDAEKLMLFEVINSRYEALKATIVISNLSGEALMDYLGEAAMDRLREGGRSVLFDWTSYRRRGY